MEVYLIFLGDQLNLTLKKRLSQRALSWFIIVKKLIPYISKCSFYPFDIVKESTLHSSFRALSINES